MKNSFLRSIGGCFLTGAVFFSLLGTGEFPAFGANQRNEPKRPEIASQGAILMDGDTGEVLFGKNEKEKYYPASITKVMTALLVLENTRLTDSVTFKASSYTNMESGAVKLGVAEGDALTVEDALYGLMLRSANDVANGLAEHVGGSVSGFSKMMNQRAKGLGAQNTNFSNPSGLNGTDHYTTAYDMALITREAFKNEAFQKIASTTVYTFPALKNREAQTIYMGHKMLYPSDNRYYPGVLGGKTGYTSKAGNTLVTAAKRNGTTLIAVILKSSQTHYKDTKTLLDYGFALKGDLAGEAARTAGEKETAAETKISAAGPSASREAPGLTPLETAAETLAGPSVQLQTGWIPEKDRWFYVKEDKSRARSEILLLPTGSYWFDDDAYMAVGWRRDKEGSWYCMRDSGEMRKASWFFYKDKWYYLGADGKMLTNTKTPDGYYVDGSGVWVN